MNQTSLDSIAEVISLALTSPTLLSAAIVICIWWKAFVRSLKTPSKERTGQQWLILGVASSFIGGFCDNLWWGSAWGRYYLQHDSWNWWFSNGVYANIPFRQMAGIIAAYCHIRSGFVHEGNNGIKLKIINIILLSVTLASLLIWVSFKL
ncbi:MAG: hypothetical protein ACSHX0_06945 [Akkermansiaceae bacterium]